MRKTEKRDVEIKYCDFCGEETEHFDKCAVCKREMCNKDGGAAHSAFSIKVYRYSDRYHLEGYGSKICKNCADKKPDGTIRNLINGMMSKDPVPME